MKKIEAIIRSTRFEAVKEELSKIGINFLTFMDVKGFGKQKEDEVYYRGAVYDIGYISRMQIEIVAPDSKVDEVVNTITKAAFTGEFGDGKIFVSNIEKVFSIRTGEEGEKAL